MPSPDLLFVLGLGRSGTSALTDLLNSHPRIGLGMERYKFLYGRRRAVSPELFERERFFDFGDGFTNITPETHQRWADFYDQLDAKWDSLAFVGDKMTTPRIQHIWRTLPEARFVCIVRDIEQVAASWDARARNPKDVNWPERADARRSVEQWNQTLHRVRRALKHRPQQVVVVEHARLFGDPDGASMLGVLDWLGLDRCPAMDAHFSRAHTQYVETVAPKERILSPDVSAYLRDTADRAAWRQLLRRAV